MYKVDFKAFRRQCVERYSWPRKVDLIKTDLSQSISFLHVNPKRICAYIYKKMYT